MHAGSQVDAHLMPTTMTSIPTRQQLQTRLLIVANRLPVTLKCDDEGSWTSSSSSGGVATLLRGYAKDRPILWYGWPGDDVLPHQQQAVARELKKRHKASPVFINKDLSEKFYEGFSNSTLWPLFHYFLDRFVWREDFWDAYVKCNEKFAEAVLKDVQCGDVVWVQDYHLMLLPGILRRRLSAKDVKIGWSQHVPFPHFETFRVIPRGKTLLESVLQSDLISLDTPDYVDYLLDCCARLLCCEVNGNRVKMGGRSVPVSFIPIGIHTPTFWDDLDAEGVLKHQVELKNKYQGKIVLGVERLEYTKGIPHKLMLFDRYLKKHPEAVGNVTLVQVAIPSRTGNEDYQKLTEEAFQLASDLNNKYCVEPKPIQLLHRSVSHHELLALYQTADVCSISAVRDGVNLVAHEYVACQRDRKEKGVLMLSEFTGAAKCFGAGVIFNPWDIEASADVLHDCLIMPPEEKETIHIQLLKCVIDQRSEVWGATFMKQLSEVSKTPDDIDVNGKRY